MIGWGVAALILVLAVLRGRADRAKLREEAAALASVRSGYEAAVLAYAAKLQWERDVRAAIKATVPPATSR